MFEAEAKASRLRPRPECWPRGHFGFEDLTSLVCINNSVVDYSAKVLLVKCKSVLSRFNPNCLFIAWAAHEIYSCSGFTFDVLMLQSLVCFQQESQIGDRPI